MTNIFNTLSQKVFVTLPSACAPFFSLLLLHLVKSPDGHYEEQRGSPVCTVNVRCGSYMHAHLHWVVLYMVLCAQAVIFCLSKAVHNPAARRASLFCSIMKEDDQ